MRQKRSISVPWREIQRLEMPGNRADFGSDGKTLRSLLREMATTWRFRGSVKK